MRDELYSAFGKFGSLNLRQEMRLFLNKKPYIYINQTGFFSSLIRLKIQTLLITVITVKLCFFTAFAGELEADTLSNHIPSIEFFNPLLERSELVDEADVATFVIDLIETRAASTFVNIKLIADRVKKLAELDKVSQTESNILFHDQKTPTIKSRYHCDGGTFDLQESEEKKEAGSAKTESFVFNDCHMDAEKLRVDNHSYQLNGDFNISTFDYDYGERRDKVSRLSIVQMTIERSDGATMKLRSGYAEIYNNLIPQPYISQTFGFTRYNEFNENNDWFIVLDGIGHSKESIGSGVTHEVYAHCRDAGCTNVNLHGIVQTSNLPTFRFLIDTQKLTWYQLLGSTKTSTSPVGHITISSNQSYPTINLLPVEPPTESGHAGWLFNVSVEGAGTTDENPPITFFGKKSPLERLMNF